MYKEKLLIVDDSPINRSLLIDILSSEYEIIEVENGLEAITYMEKHIDEIVLVLLDIIMPIMDGFEVLNIMNKNGWIQSTPVITITSETASKSIDTAYNLGVSDYINRPFDELIVQKRVKNTILLFSKQKRLENMVTEQILEKEKNNLLMIEILSHIVEFRNGESGLHVLRIRIITELIMKDLTRRSEQYYFTDSYIGEVMNAAALHDIGKIMIDDEILNKPNSLTDEEFEAMKTHCVLGARILEKIPYFQQEGLIQTARDICRWHHERYDGNGYPDGLVGNQIPICAQVVALADVYDALTSKRVYKPPYDHDKAVEMIMNGECGAFNPLILESFNHIAHELNERLKLYNSKNILINLESQNMKEHLLKRTGVSNRTLTLLEQERTKYKFFASMSGEIQFEYSYESNTLSLSEWGAMNLFLPEIIIDPMHSELLHEVIPKETLGKLENVVSTVSMSRPNIEIITQIKIQGEWRWFKLLARPLWVEDREIEMTGLIGKCVDIHEEHMKMSNLKKIADQDSLTKLWNHAAAREQIELLMTKRTGDQYAMMLIDLDYFKDANDSFGHMFGDEVLRYVAEKLLKYVKSESIISRVGGDEFMIFLKYDKDINSIVQQIHHSISCDYKGFKISLSVGVSLFPQNSKEYDTLYNLADKALYTAKKQGRKQYCFYNEI